MKLTSVASKLTLTTVLLLAVACGKEKSAGDAGAKPSSAPAADKAAGGSADKASAASADNGGDGKAVCEQFCKRTVECTSDKASASQNLASCLDGCKEDAAKMTAADVAKMKECTKKDCKDLEACVGAQ